MLDAQTALLIGSAIEAVEAANIEPTSVRPQLLHAISVRLDEERHATWIDALVDVANTAKHGGTWADLAPLLKGNVLERVFDKVMDIWGYQFENILRGIAPNLSQSQLVQAFATALGRYSGTELNHPLTALAPYLPENLAAHALDIAFTLNGRARTGLLTALGSVLTPALQDKVMDWIHTPLTEQDLIDYREKERAASKFGRDSESVVKHFHTRQKLDDLTVVAAHLNERHLNQALYYFLTEDSAWYITDSLIILAPYLHGVALDDALVMAQNLSPMSRRVLALAAVAPHAEEPLRSQLMEYALNLTRKLPPNRERLVGETTTLNETDRVRALLALAPDLNERLARYALVIGLRIHYLSDRSHVAEKLAPYVPDDMIGWLIDAAIQMSAYYREGRMAAVLTALAPRLHGDELTRAFEAVLGIPNYQGSPYPYAVAWFAQYLTGDSLIRGIAAVATVYSGWPREKLMVGLTQQVIKEVQAHGVQPALDAALSNVPPFERVRLYLAIASALPEPLRSEYIQRAEWLVIGRKMANHYEYLRALLLALRTGALDPTWLAVIQTALEKTFAKDALLAAAFKWLCEHPDTAT